MTCRKLNAFSVLSLIIHEKHALNVYFELFMNVTWCDQDLG